MAVAAFTLNEDVKPKLIKEKPKIFGGPIGGLFGNPDGALFGQGPGA
jgi:hypothetical protein